MCSINRKLSIKTLSNFYWTETQCNMLHSKVTWNMMLNKLHEVNSTRDRSKIETCYLCSIYLLFSLHRYLVHKCIHLSIFMIVLPYIALCYFDDHCLCNKQFLNWKIRQSRDHYGLTSNKFDENYVTCYVLLLSSIYFIRFFPFFHFPILTIL